mgnify:CR=1 FL=1|jgi:hypothetical protein
MPILKKLIIIFEIILVMLIILMAIAAGVYIIYKKKKKPSSVMEEETDYSNLKRQDAISYVKFDEIKSDMVITNNGNRFVGAIKCKGFDFFSSQPNERKRAHDGYLGFINLINKPITYRQYTKNVDMDDTIQDYQRAYDQIEKELFFISQDYDKVLSEFREKKLDGMDMDTEMAYLVQLEDMNKRMDILGWRRDHMADNLDYAEDITSNAAPESVETYIFDWLYEPLAGIRNLTQEEINKKAKKELARIANSYIHALGAAGVRSTRIKTDELRQMNRRHWHPVTANRFKLKNIENSNFYDDITAAPALTEADYLVAEQEGTLQEIYAAQEDYMAQNVPGRIIESIPYEQLLAHARGEDAQNEDEITPEMLDERKSILVNHFKAAEEKRIAEEKKQEEEQQRIQRRRRNSGGNDKKDKKSNSRINYGYSEFDIGGISDLFSGSVR